MATSRAAPCTCSQEYKATSPSFSFGSSNRQQQRQQFISNEHVKVNLGSESPGPCVYSLDSAVGQQSTAKNVNAPSWVFGSSNRFRYNYEKEAYSKPGPGSYQPTSSMGKQAYSTKVTGPKYGFGKPCSPKVFISPEHSKVNCGLESPGPNYQMSSSIGKQSCAKKHTAPSWAFGSANRFLYTYEKEASRIPGPGSYSPMSSLGVQEESKKITMSAFGFGSSNREHAKQVYLTPAHEKVLWGKESPGPSTYTLFSSIGNQPRAKCLSAPQWAFGSSDRFALDTICHKSTNTPGPGSYCI